MREKEVWGFEPRTGQVNSQEKVFNQCDKQVDYIMLCHKVTMLCRLIFVE